MRQMLRTESEIAQWLDERGITNFDFVYHCNFGLMVDVHDSVFLGSQRLEHIPVKFHEIEGSFYCDKNKLTNLNFCPLIVQGKLNLSHNALTQLKGVTKDIKGSLDCSHNLLTSFAYAPAYIGHNLYFHSNRITSLVGMPRVERDILGEDNLISSLKGVQSVVNGRLVLSRNLLTSLEDGPQEVRTLWVDDNKIDTLLYLPQRADSINFSGNEALGESQYISSPSALHEIRDTLLTRESLQNALPEAGARGVHKI